jgi:hypothetical protein
VVVTWTIESTVPLNVVPKSPLLSSCPVVTLHTHYVGLTCHIRWLASDHPSPLQLVTLRAVLPGVKAHAHGLTLDDLDKEK